MFEKLKVYCARLVPLSPDELDLIDSVFESVMVNKKGYLFQENQVCDFVAFIQKGSIRHYHIKDGVEKTCDISFEAAWVTDFQSFTRETPGKMNLQAMEDSTLLLVRKPNLLKLYAMCSKYETFGRLMAEQVAQRATDIAMSLSSDKPEERFQKLFINQPDLFQRVPQKYIANFLGISPESLSRIRKRVMRKEKS